MEEITKTVTKTTRTIAHGAAEATDFVAGTIQATEHEIDATLKPLRTGLSHRFPSIYVLLVTLGVTATVLGIEQLLMRYQLLSNYPWLILALGVGLLVFTGTLYKKLG
jgi:hypothetical protein